MKAFGDMFFRLCLVTTVAIAYCAAGLLAYFHYISNHSSISRDERRHVLTLVAGAINRCAMTSIVMACLLLIIGAKHPSLLWVVFIAMVLILICADISVA